MKDQKTNNNQHKEEIKMKKYIVEAPEPEKGQKASSGGIREGGRMASQFKNPVPYEEPTLLPSLRTQPTNSDVIRKDQVRAFRNKAGVYFLGIAWQELGEPIFRSELRKIRNKIINNIEASVHDVGRISPEVIDVEEDGIKTTSDDEKIVPFYRRKAE